jgi:hypothetical protein
MRMSVETWIAMSGMLAMIGIGILGAFVLHRMQSKSKASQTNV